MNMNEGVHTVQNVLAEYDVLKLGVFLDAPLATHKRAKTFIAHVTAGQGRDALLGSLGLSLSI